MAPRACAPLDLLSDRRQATRPLQHAVADTRDLPVLEAADYSAPDVRRVDPFVVADGGRQSSE